MSEGRLDRQALVTAITTNTALERQDADQLATRIEAQFAETRGQVQEGLAKVQRDAMVAAENTGTAFLGVFGALLLGMVAAIGGALVATAMDDRRRLQPTMRDRQQPRIEHREVPST